MSFREIKFLNKKTPELIFGSLTMAPLQRNMSPQDGGKVISSAISRGLRWIDTAQMYGSYPHVKEGIKRSGIDKDLIVISTKSTSKSYDDMNSAIDEALKEMDLNYIDLFLLHAVKSVLDFKERSGAFKALLEAKEKGIIGSVGISTHSIKCAKVLATDSRIEWYHLMFNKKGIGLTDGTIEDQEENVRLIKQNGGKIYAMKPLGGGYLKNEAEESLKWVKAYPLIDAIALGMTTEDELDMNLKIFKDEEVSEELSERLKKIDKKLFVFKGLCIGCMECEKVCEQVAIIVDDNKKAVVQKDRCILCGYCVPVCPKFALRII